MSIARLKVTLDDVKPQPVRRIEVPLDIKLSDLHLVIQAAMPRWNYHLYEFRIRDIGWGIPDPNFSFGDGPLDARKATLRDVLEHTGAKSLKYLYDFGDGWQHTVKIERITEPEAIALGRTTNELFGLDPAAPLGRDGQGLVSWIAAGEGHRSRSICATR